MVVVLGFLFSIFHVRPPHEPTLKESALWSAFYVSLAMIFGVFLWFTWVSGQPQHGLEFFASYITESAQRR